MRIVRFTYKETNTVLQVIKGVKHIAGFGDSLPPNSVLIFLLFPCLCPVRLTSILHHDSLANPSSFFSRFSVSLCLSE